MIIAICLMPGCQTSAGCICERALRSDRRSLSPLEDARETLERCAKQFDFYEQQHLAKSPPDLEKAKVNREFADDCIACLGRIGA